MPDFLNSSRYGIQYPDPGTRTATPDVPRDIAALVAAIEQSAMYGQGTLAARPVSTVGSPGKQGRFYMATDQNPHALFYDNGTGWDEVGSLAAGTIGTTQLADNAVTNVKMADNSVGAAEIIDGSVGAAEIADGSVAFAELAAALKPSQGAAGAAEALRAIGAGAGNVIAGNDSRLTEGAAGSPTVRTLGAGATQALPGNTAVVLTSDAKLTEGAAGSQTVRSLGTGATQAAPGNDSRFNNIFVKKLTGRVAADGTIQSGTGFTVTPHGGGSYSVNFSAAFAATPVVLISMTDGSAQMPGISNIDANHFDVQHPGAADHAFNFLAVSVS